MDWAAVAARRPDGCSVVRFAGHAAHTHDVAQVVFVAVGEATLTVDDAVVQLAESEAVWIPAGLSHALQMERNGVVLGPMVDFDPPDVGPQLIADRDLGRVMTLLLSISPRTSAEVRALRDELHGVLLAKVRPYFPLTLPRHPCAMAVAREAARGEPLRELAARQHISVRQLQRLFRQETGQPFSTWRTRARLNRAIAALRAGHSIQEAQHAAHFTTREGLERAIQRETGHALLELVATLPPNARSTAAHRGPTTSMQ